MSITTHTRFFSVLVLAIVAAMLVFFGTGCESTVHVQHDPQTIKVQHEPQRVDVYRKGKDRRRRHQPERK